MNTKMKYISLFFLFTSFLAAQKPELVLLNNYKEDTNVSGWYMSEKLDGVRAYWDGEKLISRSGKVFSVPAFFIKDFPSHKLDGELWKERNAFSSVVSIVNKKNASNAWNQITYNIFEVPDSKGDLLERLERVKESKYIKLVKQIQVKNKKHLKSFLKEIENLGGEGIVVRDPAREYYTGRTDKALKVKSYIDTECEIVGYNEGKGKYANMLGSLSCQMENMQIIKIGSGLNNTQRISPPPLGTVVNFKYYGLTSKGNPRFPIFLKIKEK